MASAIIEEVVEECVEEAVETAVEEAVEGAVEDAVEEAVEDAVEEAVEQVNFLKRGESRTFDRGPPPQHTPILVFFFFYKCFLLTIATLRFDYKYNTRTVTLSCCRPAQTKTQLIILWCSE